MEAVAVMIEKVQMMYNYYFVQTRSLCTVTDVFGKAAAGQNCPLTNSFVMLLQTPAPGAFDELAGLLTV